jgi:hypothetical protein
MSDTTPQDRRPEKVLEAEETRFRAPPGRSAQPQQILSNFQGAVDRAENLRLMQNGREVVGTVECIRKPINSERQKALHILAAADQALKELGL